MSLPKLPPMGPAPMSARIDGWPNLVTMVLDRADEHPERPMLGAKRDGAWQVHELGRGPRPHRRDVGGAGRAGHQEG